MSETKRQCGSQPDSNLEQEHSQPTFTIDRSKWFRGKTGAAGSKLRRKQDGMMCCLGFYALACGLTQEQITGFEYPRQLTQMRESASWLFYKQSDQAHDFESRLAICNDNPKTTESQREYEISALFAENGIAVAFVDREVA